MTKTKVPQVKLLIKELEHQIYEIESKKHQLSDLSNELENILGKYEKLTEIYSDNRAIVKASKLYSRIYNNGYVDVGIDEVNSFMKNLGIDYFLGSMDDPLYSKKVYEVTKEILTKHFKTYVKEKLAPLIVFLDEYSDLYKTDEFIEETKDVWQTMKEILEMYKPVEKLSLVKSQSSTQKPSTNSNYGYSSNNLNTAKNTRRNYGGLLGEAAVLGLMSTVTAGAVYGGYKVLNYVYHNYGEYTAALLFLLAVLGIGSLLD